VLTGTPLRAGSCSLGHLHVAYACAAGHALTARAPRSAHPCVHMPAPPPCAPQAPCASLHVPLACTGLPTHAPPNTSRTRQRLPPIALQMSPSECTRTPHTCAHPAHPHVCLTCRHTSHKHTHRIHAQPTQTTRHEFRPARPTCAPATHANPPYAHTPHHLICPPAPRLSPGLCVLHDAWGQ